MAKLKNHPTRFLRDDAAKLFNKAEADHGKFKVTSAGRTVAQQQALIDRWNKGGPANRPPKLYKPATPAATSSHVKGGGLAVDISDYQKFAAVAGRYGYVQSFPNSDPVHFDYTGKVKVPVKPDKTAKSRQRYLNAARWESLDVDGIIGRRSKAAIKRYQTFLKKFGYNLKVDGIWGNGTETAHLKYYNSWAK